MEGASVRAELVFCETCGRSTPDEDGSGETEFFKIWIKFEANNSGMFFVGDTAFDDTLDWCSPRCLKKWIKQATR